APGRHVLRTEQPAAVCATARTAPDARIRPRDAAARAAAREWRRSPLLATARDTAPPRRPRLALPTSAAPRHAWAIARAMRIAPRATGVRRESAWRCS